MFFGTPKPIALTYSANGTSRTKRDCLSLPMKPDELITSAQSAAIAGASVFSFSSRTGDGQVSNAPEDILPAVEAIRQQSAGLTLQIEFNLDPVADFDLGAFEKLASAKAIDSCLFRLSQILPREGDEADENRARDVLDLCDEFEVGVQFALEKPSDIEWYYAFRQYGIIPESCRALLFILGKDGDQPSSDPNELRQYLAVLDKLHLNGKVVWSAAAYGSNELSSLVAAAAFGGHVTTGLAYNHTSEQGEAFNSVQDQVSPLLEITDKLSRPVASGSEARTLLFGPR